MLSTLQERYLLQLEVTKDFRKYKNTDPRRLESIVRKFTTPFQPKGASLSKIRRRVEIQKYCDGALKLRVRTQESSINYGECNNSFQESKSSLREQNIEEQKGTVKWLTFPKSLPRQTRSEKQNKFTIKSNQLKLLKL